MRNHSFMTLFILLAVWHAQAVRGAEEPAKAAKLPIAVVLDKPIFLDDLRIEADDKTDLRDYRAIAEPVMKPLFKKYIADHRLAATPEEIKEFREWMAALPVPELNPDVPGFTADRRKEMLESRKKAQQPGTRESKALEEIGKVSVESWKFNKALYEQYGGRVIFQQAGIEPLDAYRAWLEDEEKAGNFEINVPKWNDAFWEYYKPKYHTFVDAPEPFKTPLWKMPRAATNDN
jgi:hypothetical protein